MKIPGWIRRSLIYLRPIVQPIVRLIRSVVGLDGFWWIVGIATVLATGILLSWCFWDELGNENESVSSTIRNVGLLFGGIIAMLLAVWRSKVAERQANTAQQRLLHERYERGAKMLGSGVLAVRLAGVYALERLAKEHPEEYHIQVIELLCAFVRHPTEDVRIEYDPESDGDQDEQVRRIRADVEYAVLAIGSRSDTGIALEQRSKDVKLYLREANLSHLKVSDAKLSGAWLTKANLSGATFPRARLSEARLRRAKLSGAELRNADLTDAKLWGADLSKAILHGANLSGADLCGVDAPSPRYGELAKGLIQAQLDEACADQDNLPKLDGVLDAETGEPLVWHGKPCKG